MIVVDTEGEKTHLRLLQKERHGREEYMTGKVYGNMASSLEFHLSSVAEDEKRERKRGGPSSWTEG